jgi:hypothetical protein
MATWYPGHWQGAAAGKTHRPKVKCYKDNSDDKVPDVAVSDPGADDVVDDADGLQLAKVSLNWLRSGTPTPV